MSKRTLEETKEEKEKNYKKVFPATNTVCDAVEEFVVSRTRLLEEEELAEMNNYHSKPSLYEPSEKAKYTLKNLRCVKSIPDSTGHTEITFKAKTSFPAETKLSRSDVVSITSIALVINKGIIKTMTGSEVTVAINKLIEFDENLSFDIIGWPSTLGYKKMADALEKLKENKDLPLVHMSFNKGGLHNGEKPILPHINIINNDLNNDQRSAVTAALTSQHFFVLHGPPGTGKTTTLVEIIRQLAKQGKRILVCAGSNFAVDNIATSLWKLQSDIYMVRYGRNSQLMTSCASSICADQRIKQSECIYSKDLYNLETEIAKLNNMIAAAGRRQRTSLLSKRNSISVVYRLKYQEATVAVLQQATVVFSTVILSKIFKSIDPFDVVIIDECSQIMEPACWVALLRAKQSFILAGDHYQLPAVVYSKSSDLGMSMMERLLKLYGKDVAKTLPIQYRMHSQIMAWPCKTFYENSLTADKTVAIHLLKELPGVKINENTSKPLVIIDTSGLKCPEKAESKANEGEADIVFKHVMDLIESGVSAKDIGVLSPYRLQVHLIISRLKHKHPDVEIQTIDGFQGREKEAIVVSLVRSNAQGSCGFLSDCRRLNVAITRARRHLAIVCDIATMSHSPFNSFFQHVRNSKTEIRSSDRYKDVIGCYNQERHTENEHQIKKEEQREEPITMPRLVSQNLSNYQLLTRCSGTDFKYSKICQEFKNGPKKEKTFRQLLIEEKNYVEWFAKTNKMSCKVEKVKPRYRNVTITKTL